MGLEGRSWCGPLSWGCPAVLLQLLIVCVLPRHGVSPRLLQILDPFPRLLRVHQEIQRASQSGSVAVSTSYDSSREALGREQPLSTFKGRAASERRVALQPCVSLWAVPRHLTADTVACKQLPTVTTRATRLRRSRKLLLLHQRFCDIHKGTTEQ